MAAPPPAILCTGWATKRGALKKNWKRRYFVLRNDRSLSYYKDGWSPNSKPQGVIEIDTSMSFGIGVDCSDIDWPAGASENTRFKLIQPEKRTYYLFCDTPEASMGWVTKIKQLVRESSAAGASQKTASEMSPEEEEAQKSKVKMLARAEENQYCFDCGVPGVQPWASWNLGVFLCWRCAGIHRSLGLHVSGAKSITLDKWPKEHVASLQKQGNRVAAAFWEAALPADFVRPKEKADLDLFIQQKYVTRKWAASDRRQSVVRQAPAEAPEESPRSTNPFAGSDSEDSDGDTFTADFSAHPAASPASSGPALSAAELATRRLSAPLVVAAAARAAASDPMADHQW